MPRELLVTGPEDCSLVEVEERALAPGRGSRARAIVSGISQGTELQLWRGTSPFARQAVRPGAPALRRGRGGRGLSAAPRLRVGRAVDEVGSEVSGVRSGELVHLPRPHAETHVFASTRRRAAVRAAHGLDPEIGTLLQTTTIALQAVHDASLKLGDRVAIFGLGAFGLLTVQLARLQGAGWIVAFDPIADRRALAPGARRRSGARPDGDGRRPGATTADGVGVDVAVEFSGSYAALHQAMRSVARRWHRRRGRLLRGRRARARRGVPPQPADARRLDGRVGVPPREPRWPRSRARSLAAELLATGKLETDALITHLFRSPTQARRTS